MCGKTEDKNKMVTLTARAGRRGKATSFGHMCHSCFVKWLTAHNIPVPDLEKKEINEDDKEKDMWKQECEEYIVTNEHSERLRKKIKVVKK